MTTDSAGFHGEPTGPANDTAAEAFDLQLAAIRRRAPADRLRDAMELSELMRRVALQGLAARYPDLSEQELIARFAAAAPERQAPYP